MADYVGWFVERVRDDDPDFNPRWPYRATLQIRGGGASLDGFRFATEAECLDFIRTDVIGKGLLPERR